MTKPTTIEEVLSCLIIEGSKFGYNNSSNTGSYRLTERQSRTAKDLVSQTLATIEQLVLERVIGEDELRQRLPTGGERLQITYRNTMRAKQRQALKQLLGGRHDS